MGSGRRGILVAIVALILAVNNGAFAALAFVGVNGQSSAVAATTPAVSLDQSTTKYVPPTSTYPGHTYINGDLNAQNSAYVEGDCVPFRAQMTTLDPAATQEQLVIQYEHFRAGNYGYWSIGNFAVDLGSNGTIDPVTITTSPLPDPNATDADQTVTVTFDPAGSASATLYWCGVLAIPANGHGGISSISGAPVHMRVISGTQTIGGTVTAYSIGNQDRSIQPGAIQPFPTLSIVKSGCATVAGGGTCSYSIVVSNTGTGSASGVVVTDTLPTGLTPTSATWGVSATACGISGQTVTCTIGTLAAGASVTATVNVTAGATACGTVTNTASVNATGQTQQQSSTTTQIQCASLSITKTTSTSSVALGGAATFTITVTNSANATLTATGVQVTDTLPAGFTYASLTSATGGTRTATVNPTAGDTSLTFGTWSLAPGETLSITFTATAPSAANSCGSYDNNAGYSSTNAGSGSTSSPATVTVTGCSASLSITKTTSTASVALGGAATFTITVTNSASATATATGVTLSDTLPAGFTFASGTSGGTGTRTATSNPTAGDTSLAWGTWSLAPGQTATATFTATAPSAANSCGAYNNNAGYSSTNAGSGSTSSPATVTVTGCTGNLSITKTTSTASVALGGAATFTITVTNNANATLTATGVTISDTLPAGFTYASTGAAGGTGTRTATVNPTAGQTSLTFGTWSLAPGQTASVTFTATAPSAANSCGAYNNNASVASGNDGSASTTSPATVTVVCPPPPPANGAILVGKYNDTNRNGARDAGEPPLQGFVFTVKSGTTTVATVTSDATGTATAANLPAGTYTVTETQQNGWTSTDPGSSLTKTVTVTAGQNTSVLFGNAVVQLPPTSAGTLVVTKYNDLNANKTRDANEPVLSGWTFTVKDSSAATVGSATTDASGNATFQNLSFGTYTVTETLQAGWTSTDPGGTTPTKTVTISAATTTVVFGNAQIKLPNTSTLEAPPASPTPALLFLLVVLLGQIILITTVFRRWHNDD